jgi:hypothetical protein
LTAIGSPSFGVGFEAPVQGFAQKPLDRSSPALKSVFKAEIIHSVEQFWVDHEV